MDKHLLIPLVVLSVISNIVIASNVKLVEITSNHTPNLEESILHTQFKEFVIRYNKTYLHDSVEYAKRERIFKESVIRHHQLNGEEKVLGGSAVYGVNKFSDLTPHEFKEFLRKSHIKPFGGDLNRNIKSPKSNLCDIPQKQMPARWNWHDKGKVTPIKNQGMCGSCWAFTAVEITESQWAIKTGELKKLSVQELISCHAGDGCQGGNTCQALKWMIQSYHNHTTYYTLAPESECPYEDKETSCNEHLKHCESGVTIKKPCCKYNANETTYIQPVIAFIGTVAANVDATLWHDYLSGIIQYHCSGLEINHAVQLVGFDTTGVVPYWIVRNSWGEDFGDNGYLYIEMGKNLCGLTSEVTFVIV